LGHEDPLFLKNSYRLKISKPFIELIKKNYKTFLAFIQTQSDIFLQNLLLHERGIKTFIGKWILSISFFSQLIIYTSIIETLHNNDFPSTYFTNNIYIGQSIIFNKNTVICLALKAVQFILIIFCVNNSFRRCWSELPMLILMWRCRCCIHHFFNNSCTK
jgi:hypothetical protein